MIPRESKLISIAASLRTTEPTKQSRSLFLDNCSCVKTSIYHIRGYPVNTTTRQHNSHTLGTAGPTLALNCIPSDARTATMATNDQTPPLLALQVELVGRIAESLTPDSLLMLRLTCKALEHSTYDPFAKT